MDLADKALALQLLLVRRVVVWLAEGAWPDSQSLGRGCRQAGWESGEEGSVGAESQLGLEWHLLAVLPLL